MKLRELLAEDTVGARWQDIDIAGVTADSRNIGRGFLFFAIAGAKADGARFAEAAVAAGATAVAAEKPMSGLPAEIAFVPVTNARRALALAAARLYPRQPQTIAAVTGTSGKTSVASFTRQIWTALGYQAASIGTIGVTSPKGEVYGALTTPDPVALHRTIDGLAGEGVTHLVMEASSHGLDQHRLDGVRVTAGAFTNLSRDHLDYHPTMESYLAAKLRLFDALIAPGGAGVVNNDSCYAHWFVEAANRRGLKAITVGESGETIKVTGGAVEGFAQVLRLEHEGRAFKVRLPLVGSFQAENALIAAGLVIAGGGDAAQVFAALESLEGAKGRLELVGARNNARVFVDYAHKPDALAKALEALRPYAKGRLVVVFGCGGDRDKGKRPLMGEIAVKKADRVIVTDDNPRSEDPAQIRAEIMRGAPGASEIGDRAQAIRTAIAALAPHDVLLIAGKGHETGQIVGDRVLPFSDHEAVLAALRDARP